ncbi:uncharacterized protein TRAVEDRAFT_29197 [Trametes versicolor FP-101664 SS1]|uniref:uncharacterized protein n=1 Tax=Trametes versicolor (strain FP-101664) TaxID=717944 RepID=UPI00046247AE|nr:uncharacterized protein TRAVEDRAFT_29197 [Trametes versicolor FP-101664 SS1]EIW58705.1 hypothetical protein TRAVEDRAFT_29197 [Trametes versicolor FP-101664 SS1]
MRDRTHRNDYSSSATSSPATVRSMASFSTPQSLSHQNHASSSAAAAAAAAAAGNPAVPTNQLLAVDGLLAAHAGSPNPPLAALETAVGERNSLSAQNTQLWKLIEKQRSGYNHIMKELERMRGERDLYRGRLQSLGENTDNMLRAHRAKEKAEGREGSLRSASSNSQLKANDSGAGSSRGNKLDPRAQLLRTSSDETPSRLHQLSSSRSFDPTQSTSSDPRTPERKGSTGTLHYTRSESPAMLSSASNNFLTASQQSSSSQISTSNSMTASSPLATSTRVADTTTRRSPPLTQSPTEESHQQQQPQSAVPARSDSLSLSSTPAPSPSTATPPTKVSSPRGTGDPVLGSWKPEGPPRPAPQPPQPPVQPQSSVMLTPASPVKPTAPAINGRSHGVPPIDGPSSAINGVATSNVHATSNSRPPPIQPPPAQPEPTKVNGTTNLAVRPQPSSRDSQISLPEETKRYYASMASPAVSPGMKFTFPSAPSSPLVKETHDSGSVNGVVPAGVGLGIPNDASQAQGPGGRGRTNGRVAGSDRAGSVTTTEEGAEFLDMDDEDSAYDSGANGASSGSAQVASFDDSTAQSSDSGDARARDPEMAEPLAVEDFPLPPSSQYAPSVSMSTRQGTSIDTRDSRPSLSTSDSHVNLAPFHASSQTLVSDQPPPSPFPLPLPQGPPRMGFRALPLLAEDLKYTEVVVSTSTIRPNDRGKEVLSFIIAVDPGRGKESWKIEKMYSDVLGLDTRMRATVGRSAAKKLVTLPEGRLWRDHAPAKVDQRKTALEQYLRSVITLPVKNKDEIVAFFTSDIVRDAAKPVSQAGYKEGYLTKRGKNFGGWKTRFFVLQGPSLEYYESRGGTHLGSIVIAGAQIGRQQRTPEKREGDEDNEYRHAFLIIEAKRAPNGSTARHVLCAESDQERDSWVEELVRYVTGTYNDEQVPVSSVSGPSPVSMSSAAQSPAPRSSTSSNPPTDLQTTPVRRTTKEMVVIAKGPAMPISQLAPDGSNAKLFGGAAYPEMVSNSPAKSLAPSFSERVEVDAPPLSSSLPVSSPLVEEPETSVGLGQRANSELGHYPDLVDQRTATARSPEQIKRNKMKRMSMKPPSIPERSSSPEKDAGPNTPRVDAHGKVKISGPMNGTPIPAGYKFGGKDAPPPEQPPPLPTTTSNDRREKTKSRTFKNWGFGRAHDKAAAVAMPTYIPRAVFGVSLEESLDVAQIASLPAIVFRCIQYLEAKKAEHEEGIYRLSGSSAVIKSMKDRFNAEGDVDLLASDEYWDPHAIAGLLKTFLRELPASILTRDLHLRFLSVIDFVDPQERIRELSHLISSLPVANYSLLRALTAHLILIVQNSGVNKMTMRNVGIVFSPTLGIPAGVFSLMLGEFNRVFNVDGTLDQEDETDGDGSEEPQGQSNAARRNSQHYSEAAADQMLGLAGRTLPVQQEEAQSDDGDEIVEESGTEATTENDSESLVESSAASSSAHTNGNSNILVEREQTPPNESQASRTRASALAASRGLSVATDKASRRHSRMIGLPHSPRPPPQGAPAMPGQGPAPSSSSEATSSPRLGEGLAAVPASPSPSAAPVSPLRPT